VTNGFAIFQNLLFKKINQKKSKRWGSINEWSNSWS
jgi:hypothetical protein